MAVLDRVGELLRRRIKLIAAAEQCTSEGGQVPGQRMASDETIVGIIGTSCSSAAQSAPPIISEPGQLMI
ncbi:MAG: hypothetical protein OXG78_15090 [Chloroflexi bacterium]|nr:hypothetical protein [Chloroflexota bacterium]